MRHETSFALEVPEGPGWQRLPCPYCGAAGGRPPAVINHQAGWFGCFPPGGCGMRRSATFDYSAATRFAVVLHRASWKSWRTFPGAWEDASDARAHANFRLAVYAGPADGSCAEAGRLGRWQEKAGDDPHLLDSYVMRALLDDLTDEARKRIRRKRHYHPAGDGRTAEIVVDEAGNARQDYLARLLEAKSFEDWEVMRDGGWLQQSRFPVLWAMKLDGLTRDEIKEAAKWTERQLRDWLDAEKKDLVHAFYQEGQGRP